MWKQMNAKKCHWFYMCDEQTVNRLFATAALVVLMTRKTLHEAPPG